MKLLERATATATAGAGFREEEGIARPRCGTAKRVLGFTAPMLVLLSLSPLAAPQGLPVVPPEEIGLSPAALERIAPDMQSYIDSGQVAGMVMMIARRGKLGYVRALGYSDLETRRPLSTDALFRMASIRKPLLAAATMVLVDAGRLKLDAPVSDYIRSFRDVRVYAGGSAANPELKPPARPITIRHLLTHTAGLAGGYGDHPVDEIYKRVNLEASRLTLAQYADGLAAMPLEFSPGDQWRYSRSFEVIARVLEVVSDRPLEQFLREQFLAPLGMHGTFVEVDATQSQRLPVFYGPDPAGKLTVKNGPSDHLPTGPMVSTPADYLRFAQMLLNGGTLDGKRVLSRESVTEMLRNQLPPSLTPITTPVWDHEGYGFGLGGGVLVQPTAKNAPASTGTYRWPGVSGTFFWVDPEAELVAVIWTQSSAGYWLEHHFQRLVYGAIQR